MIPLDSQRNWVADVMLNDKWLLNFDVRYINIETDATLTDGADVSTTKLENQPLGL